jgi:hypothetical protein
MFDTHVFITKPFSLVLSLDQELIQPVRNMESWRRARVPGHLGHPGQFFFQSCPQLVERKVVHFQEAGYQSVFLLQQGQGQMLNVHRLMVVPGGDVLRLLQSFLRLFGEFTQVHNFNLKWFVFIDLPATIDSEASNLLTQSTFLRGNADQLGQ